MNDDNLFHDSSDEELKPPAPVSADNTKDSQSQTNSSTKRKASPHNQHQQQPRTNKKKTRVVLPVYDDKEKALVAVNQNGLWLHNRSRRLQDDEEVVLAAIHQNPKALEFASDRLRSSPKMVWEACSKNKYTGAEAVFFASPDLLLSGGKQFVLSLLDANPACFKYLPSDSLKDDKEVALAAIQKSGDQVSYASNRLKNDRDIVLAAASSSWFPATLRQHRTLNSNSYEWITRDREIMLKAVRSNGSLLRFASPELRADRELVVAAIETGRIGGLVDILAEEFLEDRALNLLAAQKCGRFLNVELCKQDREIALAGVSKNGGLFPHLSESFRVDREIVLAALNTNQDLYSRLPESLRADREIAMAALRTNQDLYSRLPMSLKRDHELAMTAVSNGGYEQLSEMPTELQGNRDIVLAALQGYERQGYERGEEYESYWFFAASNELRSDPDIILEAVSRNGLFLKDVNLRKGAAKTRVFEIVKTAIEQDPFAFQYVPAGLVSPDIVAEVLRVARLHSRDELDLAYVREHMGESLLQKLTAINHEYELGEGNSDKIHVCEHQDVTKWSREWKKVLWHKVWLLGKKMVIPEDAKNKILQFTDILPDFRLARKIEEVGPIVEALAAMDMGVDDLVKAGEESSDSESSS